jgi:hypothetical protein
VLTKEFIFEFRTPWYTALRSFITNIPWVIGSSQIIYSQAVFFLSCKCTGERGIESPAAPTWNSIMHYALFRCARCSHFTGDQEDRVFLWRSFCMARCRDARARSVVSPPAGTVDIGHQGKSCLRLAHFPLFWRVSSYSVSFGRCD